MDRQRWFSPEETAEQLGCTRKHLYTLMKRRELGYIQLAGKGRRILQEHIDAYLSRREMPDKEGERYFAPVHPSSAKRPMGEVTAFRGKTVTR